jgi:hypothetical protein
MEEILASIRRIISEDDAPAAEAAPEPVAEVAAALAPEPEPEARVVEPEPEPEPVVADDVLELTQRVEAPKEEVGDLEVYTPPEPEPAPAPVAARAEPEEEPLVSEPSAHAAASAFTNFTAAIAMPAAGRTLEDLTRELLRPLLKAWLDENLPRIVESKVAEEVDRISRTRVR